MPLSMQPPQVLSPRPTTNTPLSRQSVHPAVAAKEAAAPAVPTYNFGGAGAGVDVDDDDSANFADPAAPSPPPHAYAEKAAPGRRSPVLLLLLLAGAALVAGSATVLLLDRPMGGAGLDVVPTGPEIVGEELTMESEPRQAAAPAAREFDDATAREEPTPPAAAEEQRAQGREEVDDLDLEAAEIDDAPAAMPLAEEKAADASAEPEDPNDDPPVAATALEVRAPPPRSGHPPLRPPRVAPPSRLRRRAARRRHPPIQSRKPAPSSMRTTHTRRTTPATPATRATPCCPRPATRATPCCPRPATRSSRRPRMAARPRHSPRCCRQCWRC